MCGGNVRSWRSYCLGLLGVAFLIGVSGCRDDSIKVDGPMFTSGSGGGDGMAALVQGRVTFEGGCLLLAENPVVWPQGTQWDGAVDEVVLANGDRVAMGENVTGGGGYLHVKDVQFDGEGARTASDCAGPTKEIAFFNPGSEVKRVG